jgi:hypothetical protein
MGAISVELELAEDDYEAMRRAAEGLTRRCDESNLRLLLAGRSVRPPVEFAEPADGAVL